MIQIGTGKLLVGLDLGRSAHFIEAAVDLLSVFEPKFFLFPNVPCAL